jgi:branched-chain amino acid transport system ATP-binding protein
LPADAIRLEGINTFYGESHVLHDLSLSLSEGTLLALLGRNGAGKTTTLHSIIGFQPARSGRVVLHGESIEALPPEDIAQKGVALVPQGRRIFKSLSVEENLTVASRISPGAPFDLKRIYFMFPRLEERARQNAGSLSGGEQQMLAIARALLTNPRIVLCDEPSEGLAPRLVEEVGVALQKLKGEGLSILLVEQNTRLALSLADRVAILNTGRLAFEGTVAEVTSDPAILMRNLGVH